MNKETITQSIFNTVSKSYVFIVSSDFSGILYKPTSVKLKVFCKYPNELC